MGDLPDNDLERRTRALGIDPQNLADFEAARRRPLSQRMRMFVRTYKPVMDDARFRAFNSTAEYRRWCNENLPRWLGYHSDDDDAG